MVCLRNICINTLHKGDNDDDDDNNNNSNVFLIITLKQRIIMANKISCGLKKQLNSPNLKGKTKHTL